MKSVILILAVLTATPRQPAAAAFPVDDNDTHAKVVGMRIKVAGGATPGAPGGDPHGGMARGPTGAPDARGGVGAEGREQAAGPGDEVGPARGQDGRVPPRALHPARPPPPTRPAGTDAP